MSSTRACHAAWSHPPAHHETAVDRNLGQPACAGRHRRARPLAAVRHRMGRRLAADATARRGSARRSLCDQADRQQARRQGHVARQPRPAAAARCDAGARVESMGLPARAQPAVA